MLCVKLNHRETIYKQSNENHICVLKVDCCNDQDDGYLEGGSKGHEGIHRRM